jgi:gliding motility-associated-like protein
MNDSVWVRKLNNPVIAGVVSKDVSCSGNTDGSITINASGTNGSITYSIDSAITYGSSNSFTTLASDDYYISVKDDSGCVTHYAGNPVQVATPLPLVLSMSGTDPDCFGNATGEATVIAGGGTSPYTYLWNTTPPRNSFNITALSGGVNYAVTVTDASNCSASGSLALADPTEVVVTTIPSNVKCFAGSDGTVVISASGGIPPYDYFLNGIFQFDSIFTGLTAGTYLATAEDANHGTGSQTFSLTEPQAFTVSAGPDLLSVRGQEVQLNGTASSANGIIGYFWSPDFHLSCTACPAPVASPDTTTLYILMAMDGDSCVGFDSMVVVVKQTVQLFIPDAFTPNGDKLNDFFEVNILGGEKIETRIYNRWGEQVYHNADQHNGILNNGDAWDGTKDGKALPYDTYIYQINVSFFDGTAETFSGSITLVR